MANCVTKLVAIATSLCTSWLPSNTWFLGPIRAHNPNGISIGSAVFAQLTAECPYTLQWDAPSPSKLPLSMGDLDPHLIHGSLGPAESSMQKASRSEQLFLQSSLVWQTDWLTDHTTRSATIGRTASMYVVLWCPPKLMSIQNTNCNECDLRIKYCLFTLPSKLDILCSVDNLHQVFSELKICI